MKTYALLAAAAAVVALSTPAYANLLTISVLPDAAVVPQSGSDPCIICATTQAHNPAGFGYNNFVSTGNTPGGNFFSTALVGGSLASGDEIDAVPYTVGQIGAALLGNLSFGVAIDVNSAQGAPPMTLDEFRLWQVDASNNNINLLAFIDGPISMPDIRTGNGSADYLLSGFDLSGLGIGDRLIFQAQFSGATDGGESFYIVPQLAATPIPAAALLFPAGVVGVGAFGRWRRRRTPAA
jgi:hypothetical protein